MSEGGLKGSQIERDGLAVFLLPAGHQGRVGFRGGSYLALLNKQVIDPESGKLLQFLLLPRNLDAYARATGFLPADTNLQRQWAAESPILHTLVQQTMLSRSYPSVPEWMGAEALLTSELRGLWRAASSEGFNDTVFYQALSASALRLDSLLGRTSRPLDTASFLTILDSVRSLPAIAPVPAPVVPPPPEPAEAPWKLIAFGALLVLFIVTMLFAKKKGVEE
jgi:hypothetical protein